MECFTNRWLLGGVENNCSPPPTQSNLWNTFDRCVQLGSCYTGGLVTVKAPPMYLCLCLHLFASGLMYPPLACRHSGEPHRHAFFACSQKEGFHVHLFCSQIKLKGTVYPWAIGSKGHTGTRCMVRLAHVFRKGPRGVPQGSQRGTNIGTLKMRK